MLDRYILKAQCEGFGVTHKVKVLPGTERVAELQRLKPLDPEPLVCQFFATLNVFPVAELNIHASFYFMLD